METTCTSCCHWCCWSKLSTAYYSVSHQVKCWVRISLSFYNYLKIPVEKAQQALQGVIMELDDCAFPLLVDVIGTDDPKVTFKDADYALLVGARPRGPGMERADLLQRKCKNLYCSR